MEYIYRVPQKTKRKIPYFYLYVLELEDDKFYVGISRNIKKRYKAHKSGEGAEWTKLHKPIGVKYTKQLGYCTYTNVKSDEDGKTIEMMKKYGRENVRGGIYCAVDQSIVDSLLGEELCREIDKAVEKYRNRKQNSDKQNKDERKEIREEVRKAINGDPLRKKLYGYTINVYQITKVYLPRARLHLAKEYIRLLPGKKGFTHIPIDVDYKKHQIYISNMEMAKHRILLEIYFGITQDSSVSTPIQYIDEQSQFNK